MIKILQILKFNFKKTTPFFKKKSEGIEGIEGLKGIEGIEDH